VRSATGQMTTFDPTGSISTTPTTVNAAGVISGYWIDSTRAVHGFVRDAAGGIASFDVPGATDTFVLGMNLNGGITGYSFDTSGQHGFVMQP